MTTAALFNLEGFPLWWDEGWTLSVARTWVETGHYGRLLAGEPMPSGLSASFPVVLPIAVSFKFLEIGVWQGRLPIALFTVASLLLWFELARRLADRRTALVTLEILLLLSFYHHLHPLYLGRQVLAEMPMLFWLLAGYLCILSALGHSPWFALPAALCFGIGIVTKAQPLPFWAVSLLLPLLYLLWQQRWRSVLVLATGLAGGFLTARALSALFWRFIANDGGQRTPLDGIYEVTALVADPILHLKSLGFAVIYALPATIGLGYALYRWLRRKRSRNQSHSPEQILRLILWLFAASWYAWFVLLSVGFPRYLAPAAFVGSLFAALWLRDLTGGRWSTALSDNLRGLRLRKITFGTIAAVIFLVFLCYAVLRTGLMLAFSYIDLSAVGAAQTAEYFHGNTPPGTRIETYESELHFFLDRPIHYPPDQIHVELNRRTHLNQDVVIDYDPLAADPEYLVVGPYARLWQLYDPVLKSGAFQPVQEFGFYQIYRRTDFGRKGKR